MLNLGTFYDTELNGEGEGPSRGFLRDYKSSDGPSFQALSRCRLAQWQYSAGCRCRGWAGAPRRRTRPAWWRTACGSTATLAVVRTCNRSRHMSSFAFWLWCSPGCLLPEKVAKNEVNYLQPALHLWRIQSALLAAPGATTRWPGCTICYPWSFCQMLFGVKINNSLGGLAPATCGLRNRGTSSSTAATLPMFLHLSPSASPPWRVQTRRPFYYHNREPIEDMSYVKCADITLAYC